MPATIEFRFHQIPEDCSFGIFDDEDKTKNQRFDIAEGSSEFEVAIPDDWQSPFQNLRGSRYVILPDPRRPIDLNEPLVEITGADFYIDVNREQQAAELNQQSVETLIHQINAVDAINGRQKFYVGLVSLESYFEHLVYGILVLSGHRTQNEFDNLNTQFHRIPVAFSAANTDFFTDTVEIRRGDRNGTNIPEAERQRLETCFQRIRRLRNEVVHAWGYRELGRQHISDVFQELGEHINMHHLDDEAFYNEAAHVLVRLYARCNAIRTQTLLFVEREIVRHERAERNY